MPDAPLQQIDLAPEQALALNEDESALVQEECAHLLRQPLADQARTAYAALEAAAADHLVPADLQEPLQSLMEVGLESGRIRRIHSAHGEMAANRLYSRLPRGRAYRASIQSVNNALEVLEGQAIASTAFQAQGPGACKLTLDAGGRRITISIRRSGLSVESVETTL